jgi:hypothetical protein
MKENLPKSPPLNEFGKAPVQAFEGSIWIGTPDYADPRC